MNNRLYHCRPIIAVFDFDGTITNTDTFLDFVIWVHGRYNVYKTYLINIKYILLYKLGFASNDIPKERIFKKLFAGMSVSCYEGHIQSYVNDRLPKLIRPGAFNCINNLSSSNIEMIIISASIIDWIQPWATNLKFKKVIATELVKNDGTLTGEFLTACPYGLLKLEMLNKSGYIKDLYYIKAYGDSLGDREMLLNADEAHYKPFRGNK
jgi:phosphatidylglycerophosphatase C